MTPARGKGTVVKGGLKDFMMVDKGADSPRTPEDLKRHIEALNQKRLLEEAAVAGLGAELAHATEAVAEDQLEGSRGELDWSEFLTQSDRTQVPADATDSNADQANDGDDSEVTAWYCIVDGCENEVSESGHQFSACYRCEIETLIDEGRTKLHEVTQEIERAQQQQLNDILLTADQAMSNQARAITAATFC